MRKRASRKIGKKLKYVESDKDCLGHAVTLVFETEVKHAMVKESKLAKKWIVTDLSWPTPEGWGIPDSVKPQILLRFGRRHVKPIYRSTTNGLDGNPYIFRTPSYFSVRRRNRDKSNRTN